jgi:hypothetical protein
MSWQGLRPDVSALTGMGRGRMPWKRRSVSLDRHTPEGWVEIARYGDQATASAALDEAIAETGTPSEFRLRGSTAGRLPARIGLIVLAAAVLATVILWIAILR